MENRGLALVVITFDGETEARTVLDSLKALQRSGRLNIDDSAVVRRGMDGKVHADEAVDSSVKGGAAIGGALGLLVGSIVFPLGGLALGAAGGALVGKMLDTGIEKSFVKDVSESLQPGSSALFVTSRGGNRDAVVAALRSHRGKVYHTTLSSDAEDALRRALAG